MSNIVIQNPLHVFPCTQWTEVDNNMMESSIKIFQLTAFSVAHCFAVLSEAFSLAAQKYSTYLTPASRLQVLTTLSIAVIQH